MSKREGYADLFVGVAYATGIAFAITTGGPFSAFLLTGTTLKVQCQGVHNSTLLSQLPWPFGEVCWFSEILLKTVLS